MNHDITNFNDRSLSELYEEYYFTKLLFQRFPELESDCLNHLELVNKEIKSRLENNKELFPYHLPSKIIDLGR